MIADSKDSIDISKEKSPYQLNLNVNDKDIVDEIKYSAPVQYAGSAIPTLIGVAINPTPVIGALNSIFGLEAGAVAGAEAAAVGAGIVGGCITAPILAGASIGIGVVAAGMAGYTGYKLYESYKDGCLKILAYNTVEFGRVKCELGVDEKHRPVFYNTLDMPLGENIMRSIEPKILKSGEFSSLGKSYYAIMLYIMGSVIPHIDKLLHEFEQDDKQGKYRAWKQYEHAQKNLGDRKKELCAGKHIWEIMTSIILDFKFPVYAKHNSSSVLGSTQIQKINDHIQQYLTKPDKKNTGRSNQYKSEYVKNSMIYFLFKSLEYGINSFERGVYQFQDRDKMALFKDAYEKDSDWSNAWNVYVLRYTNRHYRLMNKYEGQYQAHIEGKYKSRYETRYRHHRYTTGTQLLYHHDNGKLEKQDIKPIENYRSIPNIEAENALLARNQQYKSLEAKTESLSDNFIPEEKFCQIKASMYKAPLKKVLITY